MHINIYDLSNIFALYLRNFILTYICVCERTFNILAYKTRQTHPYFSKLILKCFFQLEIDESGNDAVELEDNADVGDDIAQEESEPPKLIDFDHIIELIAGDSLFLP